MRPRPLPTPPPGWERSWGREPRWSLAAWSGVSSQSPTAAGRSGGLHAHMWLHPQLRRKAPGGAKSGGQEPGGGASRMSQQQPGPGPQRGQGDTEKGRRLGRLPRSMAGQRPSSRAPCTATLIGQVVPSLCTRPPWTLTTGSLQPRHPSPKWGGGLLWG